MAETRQIGRVEEVDVIAYGRQPALSVRFKLADGSGQGIQHFVSKELLRDFMDVFPAQALQATVSRLCWVTHTEDAIVELAPLMPDEGDTLDLREPPAAMAPEATTMTEKAPPPAPAADDKPTPEQGQRWKAAIARARSLKLDIEHCRPKPGMTRADVEALLSVAEAIVADAGKEEAAA